MDDSDDDVWWCQLGAAIRVQRRRCDLSLVDLARRADLSQPFLSQVENGRARPSLLSLRHIAEALGTTPQSLFEQPADTSAPTITRRADVRSVEIAGAEAGRCRMLLPGGGPVHLLEFDGLPAEFLDYFEHDGYEVVHVESGVVEIDVAGEVSRLDSGDSMAYSSRLAHRFRSVGPDRARVLLFETSPRPAGEHAPSGATAAVQTSPPAEPRPSVDP